MVPRPRHRVDSGTIAYDRPPRPHIIEYDRRWRQDVRKVLAPLRLGAVVAADLGWAGQYWPGT